MEPVKIDHEGIKKVIESDTPYIQVGNRKFLLMEVNEAMPEDTYVVTDAEEEAEIIRALNEENPIVSEEHINRLLKG